MDTELIALFDCRGRVASYSDLLTVTTRRRLRTLVARGDVVHLWRGIYAPAPVSVQQLLAGAALLYGCTVTACLGTAAQLYGFDTEDVSRLHILDANLGHPRGNAKLRVHQRLGAPVVMVDGQRASAPAWTAVEVARSLSRPRALATLDAALRSGVCTESDLRNAVLHQAGRRGIAAVRPLVDIADGRAQSPMESETRLVLLDAGLLGLEPQYPVLDDSGMPRFHVDLAYPDAKIAIEYDGDDYHGGPLAVRRDKARIAWLQDHGWLVIVATADDVRRWPQLFVARVAKHLAARRAVA